MKIPPRLQPLLQDGLIDRVIAQVRSGKEAQVYIVACGGEPRCAKVYKEANNRSFRQAAQYQEGRKVQSSRAARAMAKRTRFGQREAEESWIRAEVDALYKLSGAGVRVPKPYGFFDGVLLMELITDADGEPAPRLDDISLDPVTARAYHAELLSQVVLMLRAGIVHGDLSEFNILVDDRGPVIIDLPQAVNAAGNNSAGELFRRDVANLSRYFGAFAPELGATEYGPEIWALYERGKLRADSVLTGRAPAPGKEVRVSEVLAAVRDARKEHEAKGARRGDNR